jgi:dipeptidyl aminopeptidase/acylaminoacyl peptidase
MNLMNGAAGFAVSENGVMVLRIGSDQANRQLQWYSRDGTIVERLGEAANYNEIALSPDGKRVATTVFTNLAERIPNISIVETATGIRSQLTFDSAGVTDVVWSPDSRSVAFRAIMSRSLPSAIRLKSVGGATDSTLYADTATPPPIVEDYSGDGKTLLLHRRDSLLALHLDRRATPIVLGRVKGVSEVRFSPDGKQVSYSSNESGPEQIYVASYPALDHRRQLSANGGRQARWRGDGKEVYFLAPDGKVMVVAAKGGADGEFSAPVALFQSPVVTPRPGINQWDVTRDGQRFLFAGAFEDAVSKIQLLTVLMNWTSMLPKQ